MRFDPKILENRPWLLEPSEFPRLLARALGHAHCPTSREMVESKNRRLEEARQAPVRAIRGVGGRVGVVAVHGPLDQRLSSELEKAGGTSLEEVGVAFDALLADSGIEAIVLHFDSPGGGIYGLEELSDKIYASRREKKIYASVDSMACSAAYWLASACETIVCTPGGDVGSVGVYAIHVDESEALASEGMKLTVVKAGKYKAEFSSNQPLSDEARDFLQEVVDEDYAKFTRALSRNRGVSIADVRNNFGQGRIVGAEKALAAKMTDRTLSFSDLIGRLTGQKASGGGNRASVEVLRARHEQEKAARAAKGD